MTDHEPPAVIQISPSLSAQHNAVAPSTSASLSRQNRDLQTIRSAVLAETAGKGLSFDLHLRHSPFVMCMSQRFSRHVRSLHHALDKALVDIVERWVSDTDAKFMERMPLERHEEELLRWMYGEGKELVPSFREHYGMWRTDYLIERGKDGLEQAVICEINSRIPFNGMWVIGLHEQVIRLLSGPEKGFVPANDFNVTRKGIVDCFDPTKPLYHVRDKWPGVDSHPLAREWEQRTGQPFITIKPAQLVLKANSKSPTRYSLFYLPNQPHNGEHVPDDHKLQEIQQCSLELFQSELAELPPLILRQISTCCTNDLRNVFLIHDKRLLGVIIDELPDLEARNVLTMGECEELRRGIARTLLPGTPGMKSLLEQSNADPSLRNKYIIKPVRDAIGNGVILARHISQLEWLSLLGKQSSRALLPSEDAVVIQELVQHIWYDIVRHDRGTTEPEKFHMIASQHLINGKTSVHGPWRLGEEVHVGLAEGGEGIVMSSVMRPEGIGQWDGREED